MAVIDDIKSYFKSGTSLSKLILINVVVFVVIKLFNAVCFLFGLNSDSFEGYILNFLALPADLNHLLFRPWTVFTYMFLHLNFLHIAFNLLWLYWFGKIFIEHLDQKKLLSVYLLGGLTGAAFFIFAFNVFPVFSSVIGQATALGASAAILAIVVAISFYIPDYSINILFLGRVKLIYIAIFSVIIDLISIGTENPGGHIAHLGGALYGYMYIYNYKRGKNIAFFFDHMMDSFFSLFKRRKAKMNISYKRPVNDMEYRKRQAEDQAEIDRILDKISKGGYESLSSEEKATLFKSSTKK